MHGPWSAMAPTLMWTPTDGGAYADEDVARHFGQLFAGPAEAALDWAGDRCAIVVNVADIDYPYDERCRRSWVCINYRCIKNNTTWEQRVLAVLVLIMHGLAMGWDVLVHCRVGKHRTGCMVMSLLMLLNWHMRTFRGMRLSDVHGAGIFKCTPTPKRGTSRGGSEAACRKTTCLNTSRPSLSTCSQTLRATARCSEPFASATGPGRVNACVAKSLGGLCVDGGRLDESPTHIRSG